MRERPRNRRAFERQRDCGGFERADENRKVALSVDVFENDDRIVREEIDPEAQGGAYLLGLRSLGVAPHGSFSRDGFARAILRAERGAREDIVGRTHNALEQAGALRQAPVSARAASLPHTG